MGNIAEKLNYTIETKEQIKNSIIAKGVPVDDTDSFRSYADKILKISGGSSVTVVPLDVTENGTYTAPENTAYSPVSVNVNAGGGNSTVVERGDITFSDYDGTVLYSYQLSELPLSELPELPTQKGLICQEWTHTLAQVNACVTELDIGATYITDDGSTRLYVEHGARKDVRVYFSQSVANGVTIYWGDGTSQVKGSAAYETITHVYTDGLDNHVISLLPNDGCTLILNGSTSMNVMGNNSGNNAGYSSMLKRVEIGARCSISNQYIFSNARSLEYCLIPYGITLMGYAIFHACYSLKSVVLPRGITSMAQSMCNNCYALKHVILPQGITSVNPSCFNNCYSLPRLVLPIGITGISSSMCNTCYSLKKLIVPEGVKTIASYAFNNNYSLTYVYFPSTLTSIDIYTFNSNYSLIRADIPPSITNIGSTSFSGCHSLIEAIIPEGVTKINVNSFASCYSLSRVKIPKSVTSIDSNAFASCYNIIEYDFSDATSIPTLVNTNAFSNIASDCKILVPAALYEAWTVATNWTVYASYLVAV